MKTLLITLTLALLVGCEERQTVDASLSQIDDAIAKFMPPLDGHGRLRTKTSSLAREIRALPTYEERRARTRQWVDGMLSFDMRTLDFYSQGRNIIAVHDLVMFEVCEALGDDSPAATADAWDFYLRMLKWLRDQTRRLGTVDRPPDGMPGNSVTNAAQSMAFRDWTNSYSLCEGTYRATIRRLEKRELDVLRKRGIPLSTCETLKRRLEKSLQTDQVGRK